MCVFSCSVIYFIICCVDFIATQEMGEGKKTSGTGMLRPISQHIQWGCLLFFSLNFVAWFLCESASKEVWRIAGTLVGISIKFQAFDWIMPKDSANLHILHVEHTHIYRTGWFTWKCLIHRRWIRTSWNFRAQTVPNWCKRIIGCIFFIVNNAGIICWIIDSDASIEWKCWKKSKKNVLITTQTQTLANNCIGKREKRRRSKLQSIAFVYCMR